MSPLRPARESQLFAHMHTRAHTHSPEALVTTLAASLDALFSTGRWGIHKGLGLPQEVLLDQNAVYLLSGKPSGPLGPERSPGG